MWRERRVAAYLYVAAVLGLAHFVVDLRTMDPSGSVRLLFLAATVCAFFAWILWSQSHARLDFSFLREPVVVFLAAYTALTALSLFFAVNPRAGVGSLAISLLTLLLLCAFCLFLRPWPGAFAGILKIFVVTGALCAALAWVQTVSAWGWDTVLPPDNAARALELRLEMERIPGLMYNANLHAAFLLLLLPFVICSCLMLPGVWKWLAAVAAVFLSLMLLMLQVRSVYLGAAAGLGVVVLSVFCFPRQIGLGRRGVIVIALSAVVVCALLVTAFWSLLPSSAASIAERIKSISSHQLDTASLSRLVVWSSTLRMASDHPLTGVGAGNFGVVIHQYYDPSDPALAGWESNWLEPHNDFLWVLAERGIPALACFAAVFLYAGTHLLRALSRAESLAVAIPALCALGGLVAYAVVSFFDFPLARPGHQAIFAFYLAVAASLPRCTKGSIIGLVDLSWQTKRAVVALALLLSFAVTAHAFLVHRQEILLKIARQQIDDENWDEAVDSARRARWSLNPFDPLGIPVVFHEGLGHLMGGREEEAIACFELAAKQSPYRDYVQQNLAVLQMQRGRYDLALAPLQGIAERNHYNPEARLVWAEACLEAARPWQAAEILRGLPPDFEVQKVRDLLARAEREMPDRARPAAQPTAP